MYSAQHEVAAAQSTGSVETTSRGSRFAEFYKKFGTILFTLIGAILGGGIGLAFVFTGFSSPILLYWLGIPGTLFIRALTLFVVPLVFSSLVLGVSSIADAGGKLRKVGGQTIALYTLTTVFGALEGLAASQIVRPFWQNSATSEAEAVTAASSIIFAKPETAAWDSLARISLFNTEFESAYNSTTAALVSARLPGYTDLWNTSLLAYPAASEVSFRLPDFLSQGPVTDIIVYAASGAVAFGVPNDSLTIVAAASGEEEKPAHEAKPSTGKQISDNLGNLLISLVPRKCVVVECAAVNLCRIYI